MKFVSNSINKDDRIGDGFHFFLYVITFFFFFLRILIEEGK